MRITRQSDAIYVDKGDGTRVHYYLFPEYEVHFNALASGCTQQWHHHDRIEETLLILSGQMDGLWRDDNREFRETLLPGDLVRVGRLPHTFSTGAEECTFVVFRLVLDGVNKSELIKGDKILDPIKP